MYIGLRRFKNGTPYAGIFPTDGKITAKTSNSKTLQRFFCFYTAISLFLHGKIIIFTSLTQQKT
jgi:hypothetical protein